MLYNILLPINQYSGSITISMLAKTMNNTGISPWLFHQIFRSLHQPLVIASYLLDISIPHEYADICY